MSERTWIGNAGKVAQVDKLALGGTWEATDVINLVINGKLLSVVAGSTTITTVRDNIVAAWNALTADGGYPEFAEITASPSSNDVLLTMDQAGIPFTLAAETTETGGGAADAQTLTHTTETTPTGPNWFDNADNWSGYTVPVDGDTIHIDQSSVDILYGLDQSAIEPAVINITMRYTGKIGLPVRNNSGSAAYEEYRPTFLTIGPVVLNIGTMAGQGSGRIKINSGTDICTVNVLNTGQPEFSSTLPAFIWKGTHVNNVFNMQNGSAGVAVFPQETSTILTLRQTGGTLVTTKGVTLTTIQKYGGSLTIDSATTALTSDGGVVYVLSGAHAAINVNGGSLYYDSTGTITALVVSNDGLFSCDRVNQARTVTNCTLNDNASISDAWDTITFTNPVVWKGKLTLAPR